MFYLLSFLCLSLIMMVYFKVAERYDIVDRPNERSSHTNITIRGGGIVFVFAILIAAFFEPYYWLPALGSLLIAIISIIDDRLDLSKKIRFSMHIIAVSILFTSLNFFAEGVLPSLWLLLVLYILVIGTINAYNFMDGINGITGLYSVVLLAGLQYVNFNHVPFIQPDMIWLPMIACGIFLFYNFRRRAKCFAGDVGSITIAYWIIYLLLKVTVISGDYRYMLFLSVYGVDTVLTLVHRIYLKQNIFQAHRMHFYQILANEKGKPHLLIAVAYASIQIVIIGLILLLDLPFWWLAVLCLMPLTLVYCLKFIKPK